MRLAVGRTDAICVGIQLLGRVGSMLALQSRVFSRRIATTRRAMAGKAGRRFIFQVAAAIKCFTAIDEIYVSDGLGGGRQAFEVHGKICHVFSGEHHRLGRHERILARAVFECLQLRQ